MSTAGKVLAALTVLFAAIWVLLAATVAQYNKNGTEAVAKLQKEIDELKEKVFQAQTDVRQAVDDAYVARYETQDLLTATQLRQSEVEKTKAQVLEIAERVKNQLEGIAFTDGAAKIDSQHRLEDLQAEQKSKADAEARVERLKGENTQLLEELESLRAKFRSSLEANRKMVQGMLGAGAPAVRPASFTP